MKLNGKRIDLTQLKAEATTAGVQVGDLGTAGNDLVTYDAEGHTIEPPAGMAAILAAHTAAPRAVDYSGKQARESIATTTGTTPAELFRATLAPLTAYAAMVDLVGVDRGNGNLRFIRATIAAKRLAGGAILVNESGGGTAKVLADHRDGTAGTWVITPSVSGNDFVVTVVGASARTVDWFFRIAVDTFTPGGLA